MKDRFTVWLALIAFTGCTSLKTVSTDELLQDREPKGTYEIRTIDGRVFISDRVEVSGTAVVIRSVIEDGKRRSLSPELTILATDIASIHRVTSRTGPVIAIGAVTVAILAGFLLVRALADGLESN
jgi:hypothetical protein